MNDLAFVAVASALALAPFAALLHVRAARRRRELAAWERERDLQNSGAEIVGVRVALDPDTSHTIWIWRVERTAPQTILPPLRDARGRAVVLEPGRATFDPGPYEVLPTRTEREEFGDAPVLESVVRVTGGAEIFVRARPVDRGADLLLAPIDGGYIVRTAREGFPSIPAPRPRPVVPWRVGVYGAIALAATLAPLAVGVFLGRVVETTWATMMCPVLVLAVFGVIARAADIERRVEDLVARARRR